jgi:FtsH-binding integral membrane protein
MNLYTIVKVVEKSDKASGSCGCGESEAESKGCGCGEATTKASSCGCGAASKRKSLLEDTLRTTLSLSLYMIVAFLFQALIIRYVPQDLIASHLGNRSSWSVPLATLISIPMYTTNLVSLGLIAGLLQRGMSGKTVLLTLATSAEIPILTSIGEKEPPMIPSNRDHASASHLHAIEAAAAVNDFLWKTYRWMAVGLGLTGIVAYLVANTTSVAQLVFNNPVLFYGLLIGELLMVIAFSAVAHRVSFAAAAGMFLAYSALNGITLSMIFILYTEASIASTFFITAGSFAGLSFVGATTRRDLTAMGRFMWMGLIGLIIASVVNIFLASPAIYWITTYAGVLIFAGLTAHDTQKLKRMYSQSGEAGNLALRGALILYLDFINLLLFLLRIFGRRR